MTCRTAKDYCSCIFHESASCDRPSWGCFWKICYKCHIQGSGHCHHQGQDASALHVSWRYPSAGFSSDKKDRGRYCLAMLGDTPLLLPKHLQIGKLAAVKTLHSQNIYFQETALSTFIISSFLWVFFLWLYKAVFFPNVMWQISQLYVNMLGKCFASTWFLTFAAPLFENWRQMSQKYRLLVVELGFCPKRSLQILQVYSTY